MISRGTWLFGLMCLMLSIWAKAMRPLFRQLTKRAPATKTLARKFSGMLFSSRTADKPEDEMDLLDVLQDKMKYAFDIDLPEDIQRQVRQVQAAREVHDLPSQMAQTKGISMDEAPKRQIVVGFMDIDPQSAAEKNSKVSSAPTRGTRSPWLS